MTTLNPVVCRWVLRRDGFSDVHIRLRSDGKYEYMYKVDLYGKWYWEEITRLSVDEILRDIARWGKILPAYE